MNIVYEEGRVQKPQLLLINFNVKDPGNYQIISYTVELYNLFGWDTIYYCLNNNIYLAQEKELAAINLDTKQFYYCREEYSVAERYAQEKISEEPYGMFLFRAVYECNGVTVYSAEIAEGDDISPVGMIYVAFQAQKPIAYMSVNLLSDNVMDNLEVEVVD